MRAHPIPSCHSLTLSKHYQESIQTYGIYVLTRARFILGHFQGNNHCEAVQQILCVGFLKWKREREKREREREREERAREWAREERKRESEREEKRGEQEKEMDQVEGFKKTRISSILLWDHGALSSALSLVSLLDMLSLRYSSSLEGEALPSYPSCSPSHIFRR